MMKKNFILVKVDVKSSPFENKKKNLRQAKKFKIIKKQFFNKVCMKEQQSITS
jgi:hypothetical protein